MKSLSPTLARLVLWAFVACAELRVMEPRRSLLACGVRKNFGEAMDRDNWDDWMHVTQKEMDGLENMEVFSKEYYTREQLRSMGIKHAPMPLGLTPPSSKVRSILVFRA